MSERMYVGQRSAFKDLIGQPSTQVWAEEGGSRRQLDLRVGLLHRSDGFEWGYSGAGPGQLALAILADCSRDGRLAVELHSAFSHDVTSKLPKEGFRLTEVGVLAWMRSHTDPTDVSPSIVAQLEDDASEG